MRKGNVSFIGMLQILFIGLKLTNHIDWSWYWVMSPILVPVALIFCLGIASAIFKK